MSEVEFTGANKLTVHVLRARALDERKKESNYYAKVVLLDSGARRKEKTDVCKSAEPGWPDAPLIFSGITSARPDVTVVIAKYTKIGRQSKTKASGRISMTGKSVPDPFGSPARREVRLEGPDAAKGATATVELSWSCPAQARAIEEERAREAKRRADAVSQAEALFADFVRVETTEESAKVAAKIVAGGGADDGDAKKPPSLERIRDKIKGFSQFLGSVQAHLKRNRFVLEAVRKAVRAGAAEKLISNFLLASMGALDSFEQSDYTILLAFLADFRVLWRAWGGRGGRMPREVEVLSLPMVRNFCSNSRESVQAAVENLFKALTSEEPERGDDGNLASRGPVDLFTLLEAHLNAVLPHISGVAVLELAMFENAMLTYFQRLMSAYLGGVRFHVHTSSVKREKASDSPGASGGAKKMARMIKGFFTPKLEKRKSIHMVFGGRGRVGTEQHPEDFLTAAVASSRRYQDLTRGVFARFEKRLLVDGDGDGDGGSSAAGGGGGGAGGASGGDELKESLHELEAQVTTGFLALCDKAAQTLATNWSRLVEFDCFGELFKRRWMNGSFSAKSKSSSPTTPTELIVQWCAEALDDAAVAVAANEQGLKRLSQRLLSATTDAYVRHLTSVAPAYKTTGGKVLTRLRMDYETLLASVVDAKSVFRVDRKEGAAALESLQITKEFLAVSDGDHLEVDRLFPKLISRLGLFADLVVRRLVSMRRDWSSDTRRAVLERFAQYAALAESGGMDVSRSSVCGGATGGAVNTLAPAIDSLLLTRLREQERISECLQNIVVVASTPCEINKRPALVIAKQNSLKPWYNLMLVFFSAERKAAGGAGGAVSASHVGRLVYGVSQDVKSKTDEMAEEMEKVFAQREAEAAGSADDERKARAERKNSVVGDAVDALTLDDFI